MEKNLDITKPRYSKQIPQFLGSSLCRGSTVPFSLKSPEVLLINCKLLKSLIGGGIHYVSKRIKRLSFNFVV